MQQFENAGGLQYTDSNCLQLQLQQLVLPLQDTTYTMRF